MTAILIKYIKKKVYVTEKIAAPPTTTKLDI
jgi:hypothetical protein